MSQRFQAEIVCRFRRDRVSISTGARKPRSCVDFAEIVCRFRQVIDWGSLDVGSDLWNLRRGGELLERERLLPRKLTGLLDCHGSRRGDRQGSRRRKAKWTAAENSSSSRIRQGRSTGPVDRHAQHAQGLRRSTGPVDRKTLTVKSQTLG